VTLTYNLNEESLQDLINLASGLFHPLKGFMNRTDYLSVITSCAMKNGDIFPLPITLDVDARTFKAAASCDKLELAYQSTTIGSIDIEDCYEIDPRTDAAAVFKTTDTAHPGVKKEMERFPYRIGGTVRLFDDRFSGESMDPEALRNTFMQKGWSTVVGFQTRNPIHRAHEHLQRIGLEICDGLFINPIIGWKKCGDFSEEAVMASYDRMISSFYPKHRVFLLGLKTQMRYAGPREAVFHAIIRRNAGCTHFIIGRDHAGVGNYYGQYEAHELAKQLAAQGNLGIQLLLLKEPYFCTTCDQIVSESSCGHRGDARIEISGTLIRKAFLEGKLPDARMMRPEISKSLLKIGRNTFVE
jgi:sulfate adenylyltransferase